MALLRNWGHQKLNAAILKPGREKSILQRHHWIFSGAIQSLPSFSNGDILKVLSSDQKLLGYAYFNRQSSIIGRMIVFGEEDPIKSIRNNLEEALFLRKQIFSKEKTNAYRLINGEGDNLPGLIVDFYNGALVMQITTLGMDRMRDLLVKQLVELLEPKFIFEKSKLPVRTEEGLKDTVLLLYGQMEAVVEIIENGNKFYVGIEEGQKTGFFLDHRDMRKMVQEYAFKKRVLNCFSYSGGFSVYAAKGGALTIKNVDSSKQALELAEKNFALNALTVPLENVSADVFDYLQNEPIEEDLVILDPPALAKKKMEVQGAYRGYLHLNRLAMKKMPKHSYLLTCSCSYHVDRALFEKIIFQAAYSANRKVRILSRHHLACDHPINVYHPEGDYLKSLLLYLA